MGIKLNESNYIAITIIIKLFELKEEHILPLAVVPKCFLEKSIPCILSTISLVYFPWSCTLSVLLFMPRLKWTRSLVTGSNFHHFCCCLRSSAPYKRASSVGGVICAPQPITTAHRWRNRNTRCWDDRNL